MSTLFKLKYCIAFCITLITMIACADIEDIQNTEGSDKLLNGQITTDHPEVGKLSGQGLCTATLIRPKLVLTAAHCIKYRSGAGVYDPFYVNGTAYRVVAGVSFGQYVGEADIAILELETQVIGVTPASLSNGLPPNGTPAFIYGFGCQDRSNIYAGHEEKQVIQFSLGEYTANLCPGDSGGPVFSNGSIIGVNSGFEDVENGQDIFGQVAKYYNELTSHINGIEQVGLVHYLNNHLQNPNQNPNQNSNQNQGQIYNTCGEFYTCLRGCNDESCGVQCRNMSSQQAVYEFGSVDQCAVHFGCTTWECVEQQCSQQIATCTGQPTHPQTNNNSAGLSCQDLDICVRRCAQGDQVCLGDCYGRASAQTGQVLQDYYGCYNAYCLNHYNPQECMAYMCQAQINACFAHQ